MRGARRETRSLVAQMSRRVTTYHAKTGRPFGLRGKLRHASLRDLARERPLPASRASRGAIWRSNAARVETATDPSRRWRTAVGRRARSDRAQGRLVQRDEIVRRAGGSRRAAAWSSAPSRPGSGCCRRESSTCQRVCWTLKGVSQLLVSQVTDAEQCLTVEAEETGCVQHSLGQTGADRGLR